MRPHVAIMVTVTLASVVGMTVYACDKPRRDVENRAQMREADEIAQTIEHRRRLQCVEMCGGAGVKRYDAYWHDCECYPPTQSRKGSQ